jgi:transcriptional regulator with XRE-family HTH domain
MSEFNFLENAKDDIPEDVRIYVKKSMDILDHLHELMETNNINQRQLAERMGKKEAEVSKWLNGVQNFTLKTLAKLEAALKAPVIQVPNKKFREEADLSFQLLVKQPVKYDQSAFKFELKTSGSVQSDTVAA